MGGRRPDLTKSGTLVGRWVLAALIAILAVGCGGESAAPSETTRFNSAAPSPRELTTVPPPPPWSAPSETITPWVLTPGPPAGGQEPTGKAPLSPAEQIDQDIKGLLTRDARWQAPKSLRVDQTANIALSIGDTQALQNEIGVLVPTVAPRPAQPVKIGSTVRVQLTADTADASITPLEAIDNSIGEQTSMLFSWRVHPHKTGQLLLVAHIEFPLANNDLRSQDVPLNITVDNTASHFFLNIIENFWVQLTAIASLAGTAAKFIWSWYRRRRAPGPVAPDKSDTGVKGEPVKHSTT
jgi:hypothetical protein